MSYKKTKNRQGGLTFSVWRYYAPADLVSSNSSGPIPIPLLPRMLSRLGHTSLTRLKKEIQKYQRHGLPKELQSKVKKLFSVYSCNSPAARSLAVRDLRIAYGRRTYSLPYPFAICSPIKVTSFVVSDFGISPGPTKRFFTAWGRFGISTGKFLKPKNVKHTDMCCLIAEGKLHDPDMTAEERNVILKWLTANGLSDATSMKAAQDEGFLSDVSFQVFDRIEEFVGIVGADELSIDGEPLYLQGDEEKGFSLAKKKS